MVDDVPAAEPRVLALGARRLPGGDSHSPVYADPAGHPFCLIPRPRWAPPIGTPGEAPGETPGEAPGETPGGTPQAGSPSPGANSPGPPPGP